MGNKSAATEQPSDREDVVSDVEDLLNRQDDDDDKDADYVPESEHDDDDDNDVVSEVEDVLNRQDDDKDADYVRESEHDDNDDGDEDADYVSKKKKNIKQAARDTGFGKNKSGVDVQPCLRNLLCLVYLGLRFMHEPILLSDLVR